MWKSFRGFNIRLAEALEKNDFLIITADRGNDSIHHGTNHPRDYVHLIVHSEIYKR